ncbi:MAG: HAMP domain-containing histidine kinase [Elusimicrobia bacterium]|nr:HAMP domain-containing histidine kinase [Elusimicrobiota bacterium]
MEFVFIIFIPLLLLLLAGGFIVVMQASGFVQSSYMNRKQRVSNMLIQEYIKGLGVAQNQIYQRSRQLESASLQLALSNQQLEQLNEMKSKFLSMVVHDIRTPLASIKGFTGLLAKQMQDKKQTEYLNYVSGSVEHMNRLISDLTDLAMIESGKLKVEKKEFIFAGMIREILPGILMKAGEKGVEVKTAEIPENLRVTGDKFRLSQVVLNLLNNSLKFTPPGGKIEIRTKSEGRFIGVYVKDTGIGMDPGETKKIFAKFYQAKSLKDEALKKQGWGLGLAIANEIIRLHKGQIGAQSQGPGKGSTFWFKIPIK